MRLLLALVLSVAACARPGEQAQQERTDALAALGIGAIYTNAFVAPWSGGGWGATAPVEVDGSFSTTIGAAHQAFSFEHWASTFVVGETSTWVFSIRVADVATLDTLVLGVDNDRWEQTLSTYVTDPIAPATWLRVAVPLKALAEVGSRYQRLAILNRGENSATIALDDVSILAVSSASTAHGSEEQTPPTPTTPAEEPTPSGATEPEPSVPVTIDAVVSIDTTVARTPISRFIYGKNAYTGTPKNLTFDRLGGDRMGSYNWESNLATSGQQGQTGENYYYSWFSWDDATPSPAALYLAHITANRARSAATALVLPMLSYLAGNAQGQTNMHGHYLDFYTQNIIDSGLPAGAASVEPNTQDGVVKQDEFLTYVRARYASDLFTHSASKVIVNLDNEPELWNECMPALNVGSGSALAHADFTPDAAGPSGLAHDHTALDYTERALATMKMIRRVLPNAEIMGPGHYGFEGMIDFNRSGTQFDENNWFIDYFLARVNADESTGENLLNVYDMHHYPAPDFGQGPIAMRANPAKSSDEWRAIIDNPLSYWDPTYNEHSWLNAPHLAGNAINLLPRLKEHIADAGRAGKTKIAITEYQPGGGATIAGALAEADTLGIFGREGVYAAGLWPVDGTPFLDAALRMFRDYDGENGSFGDTSVRATFSDKFAGSAYASLNTGNENQLIVVLINKQPKAQVTSVTLTHAKPLASLQPYTLTEVAGEPVITKGAAQVTHTANAFVYTMPAYSVSTLVLSAQ